MNYTIIVLEYELGLDDDYEYSSTFSRYAGIFDLDGALNYIKEDIAKKYDKFKRWTTTAVVPSKFIRLEGDTWVLNSDEKGNEFFALDMKMIDEYNTDCLYTYILLPEGVRNVYF